jgi:hypothetical protein
MHIQQPGSQFGDRPIGSRFDPSLDGEEVAAQFAWHVTALRPGRPFAGAAVAGKNFGDVRHTDEQRFSDPPDGQPASEAANTRSRRSWVCALPRVQSMPTSRDK